MAGDGRPFATARLERAQAAGAWAPAPKGSALEEASAGPGWLSSGTERALAPEAERHHPLWAGRKMDGSLNKGKAGDPRQQLCCGKDGGAAWHDEAERVPRPAATVAFGFWVRLLGPLSEWDQPSHTLKGGRSFVLRAHRNEGWSADRARALCAAAPAGPALPWALRSLSFPACCPAGAPAAEGRLSRRLHRRHGTASAETARALGKETATERELGLLALSF